MKKLALGKLMQSYSNKFANNFNKVNKVKKSSLVYSLFKRLSLIIAFLPLITPLTYRDIMIGLIIGLLILLTYWTCEK